MTLGPREPSFADKPFEDPTTISEMASNSVAEIFNQAQAGVISWIEARQQMHDLEKTSEAIGEGWFDRYGPSSPELAYLFEADQSGGAAKQ